MLGEIYKKKGDIENSILYLIKGLQNEAGNMDNYIDLSEICENLGHHDYS
jgi:hypothetical protein